MKLSISLNKPKPKPAPVPIQRPSAFSAAADEDEDQGLAELLTKNKGGGPVRNLEPTRAMKRRMEAEKLVDETVYEYDEVYDTMQEAKLRQQALKEVDSTSKKPKYIDSLLAAAATRKLDHLRAEEKLMQREREAEGDLYSDKEAFVTQAYKDQMEEVRKAEEEEKRREELRKKQSGPSTGLAHLYRQLLNQSEEQHEATVAATQKRVIGPQVPSDVNLTITRPPAMTKLSDAELARRAREQGKDVELNDDGEIVDRTELLSGGLNLSLPNTRQIALQKAAAEAKAQQSEATVHRAAGVAASRREINERRAREMKRQMEEEIGRKEKESQDAEAKKTQQVLTRRNDESDINDARARYLERRKRQKLEQESAAAEGV